MKRALTTLLLTLCFSAASHEGAAAQERTKTPPQPGDATAAEAVGSLVSVMKKARGHRIPRTQSTQRLSGVRAEGCVLRYNLVTEYESPNYQSQGGYHASGSYPSDRPLIVTSDYRHVEREVTVNLSDLDASRVWVRVENQLKKKSGGSVIFRTSGGKESILERWMQSTRMGTRPTKRLSRGGALPVGDDGSLEAVAGALRLAAEVCAAGVR